MAVDANAQVVTVILGKTRVTASRAAIQKLFGSIPSRWERLDQLNNPLSKRPYGSRQRTNARAGEPMTVLFEDGDTWTYRVSGLHKKFLSEVLAKTPAKISNVFSQRGTVYGPQPESTF